VVFANHIFVGELAEEGSMAQDITQSNDPLPLPKKNRLRVKNRFASKLATGI
jgi:hypothetical protein